MTHPGSGDTYIVIKYRYYYYTILLNSIVETIIIIDT